jgi:hypothetical protein
MFGLMQRSNRTSIGGPMSSCTKRSCQLIDPDSLGCGRTCRRRLPEHAHLVRGPNRDGALQDLDRAV